MEAHEYLDDRLQDLDVVHFGVKQFHEDLLARSHRLHTHNKSD